MRNAHRIATNRVLTAWLTAAGVVTTCAILAAGSLKASNARVFFLDITGGRVLSVNPDGSNLTVLLSGHKTGPDGVVVDAKAGHVYWTNMGKANDDDGSIERMDVDGSHLMTVVPQGGTFTAKQLKLDAAHGKLYWADREGMRIMRANLDGSKIETLVETGRGDAARRDAKNWCVGIALDMDRHYVYWTQKGGSNANQGSIRRANLEIPAGQDAATRKDIEVLFDRLPEPIDLEIDPSTRLLYWTDRGDPPRGNTVSRAPMDPPHGAEPANRTDQQILVTDLREGIGISLDGAGRQMFFTDLGGSVYRANLDGTGKKVVLTGQGGLTGIVFVDQSQ